MEPTCEIQRKFFFSLINKLSIYLKLVVYNKKMRYIHGYKMKYIHGNKKL